jgi:PepSY-associated TM region
MRLLIALHRWWGVLFCLLFAAWFASGIVMHFVPYPAPSEADYFAGLVAINSGKVAHGPAEAIAASGMQDALRVRLVGRSDGPVYLIVGPSAVVSLRADELRDAKLGFDQTPQDIAKAYARSRGLDASTLRAAELISFDQWTVSGDYDADRPLYRVALDDLGGTELYLSSISGAIVLVTTRRARALNYAGSIVHWIYPAALRHHRQIWSALLWWLSLSATCGAGVGIVIGLIRLAATHRRNAPAYRGLQSWHYRLGLAFAPFILSWIFSGFLSMDNGLLFSRGASRAEALVLAGAPAWQRLSPDEVQRAAAGVKEIEWFALAGKIYRRERGNVEVQRLVQAGPAAGAASGPRAFLAQGDIDPAAKRFGDDCGHASVVGVGDSYRTKPAMPDAPVFRVTCGEVWFDIDGATGALADRLDRSRRAYRWLFGGLHTLDFPALTSRPWLRTSLIVALCLCGFAFSLLGVVLAWRRLRSSAGERLR